MANDAILELKMNPQAKLDVHALQLQAVKEVFELDIKPEAARLSPVTAQGLEHNIALHRKRPGGTGTNRRSIDTQVVDSPQGPSATLFTQSGYGGYLEVGTRKMAAQPYLYPAFLKFKDKIAALLKEKIRGRN